jgi:hypothetical protein
MSARPNNANDRKAYKSELAELLRKGIVSKRLGSSYQRAITQPRVVPSPDPSRRRTVGRGAWVLPLLGRAASGVELPILGCQGLPAGAHSGIAVNSHVPFSIFEHNI